MTEDVQGEEHYAADDDVPALGQVDVPDML